MNKYLDLNGLKYYHQTLSRKLNNKFISISIKGKANGVASLDENGNIPLSQLGNVDNVLYEIVDALPTELTEKQKNHIFIVPRGIENESDKNTYKEYIYTGEDLGHIDPTYWEELGEFTSEIDLKSYSKKNETIKDIEVFNPNWYNDDDDAPSKTSIRIEFADETHKYVDIPEASEPFKVVNTTYPGNAGLMSISDKIKLNSIPVKYIPTSDGVINESMTFNKNIYLKDVYITGYIAGENLEEGVRFNGCAGIEHFNQDDAIKSKLWNAQGGTIDISEILINAAIHVQGIMTRATGPADYDSVIDFPDSIIFDITTGVFYAKKNDKLYARWNAYLGKGIYSPEKYGVVDNNRVYPLPKQMYKFEEDSNLYICSYINNLATMKILTI